MNYNKVSGCLNHLPSETAFSFPCHAGIVRTTLLGLDSYDEDGQNGEYGSVCESSQDFYTPLLYVLTKIWDRHLVLCDGLLSPRSKLVAAMRSSSTPSSVLMNSDGRPLSTTSQLSLASNTTGGSTTPAELRENREACVAGLRVRDAPECGECPWAG
jgi:hypothetical protein